METKPTLSSDNELLEKTFAAHRSCGFTQALWNTDT